MATNSIRDSIARTWPDPRRQQIIQELREIWVQKPAREAGKRPYVIVFGAYNARDCEKAIENNRDRLSKLAIAAIEELNAARPNDYENVALLQNLLHHMELNPNFLKLETAATTKGWKERIEEMQIAYKAIVTAKKWKKEGNFVRVLQYEKSLQEVFQNSMWFITEKQVVTSGASRTQLAVCPKANGNTFQEIVDTAIAQVNRELLG